MLNSSQAETIVKRMTLAAKGAAQRRWRWEMGLRLDYYEGRQLADLRAAINRRFPRTCESVYEDAQVYNLTRQIVDARSQVYHRQPERTLISGATGEPLSDDSAAVRLFDDLVERGEFDNRLELLNRRVNLWCSAAVWPRFRDHGGEQWIKLEIVGPHQIWCVQDVTAIDELQACEAVAILLAGRTDSDGVAEPSRFACYTQAGEYYEFKGEINDDGTLRCLEITIEPTPTGYGMIPVVAFHDGIPSGQLWVTEDEDLLQANRSINVMLTDLEHVRKRQAHSTLVRKTASTDKPQEVVVGVDAVIDLDGETGEDAFYISPEAKLLECRDIIHQTIKMQASNRGISPNRFSVQDRVAMSGVAKMLDELDLLEDVARQQRQYLRAEARLFNAVRAVWNAHVGSTSGRSLPAEVQQKVGFVPFQFAADPEVAWRLTQEQVEAGGRPAWHLVRYCSPDLTEEQAQAQLEANLAEIGKITRAKEPSRFGDFGSSVLDDGAGNAAADGEEPTGSESAPAALPEETLNGPQIKALQEILISVAEGDLPKATAREMIAAAFPIAPERIEAMLAPIVEGSKEPEPPPAPFGQPQQKPPVKGKGDEDGNAQPD